jgi:hypothetical protein
MHTRLLISSYFLIALLLCGILLHAGKYHTRLCPNLKLLPKTGNTIVKAKAAEEMNRFIPSVLLF